MTLGELASPWTRAAPAVVPRGNPRLRWGLSCLCSADSSPVSPTCLPEEGDWGSGAAQGRRGAQPASQPPLPGPALAAAAPGDSPSWAQQRSSESYGNRCTAGSWKTASWRQASSPPLIDEGIGPDKIPKEKPREHAPAHAHPKRLKLHPPACSFYSRPGAPDRPRGWWGQPPHQPSDHLPGLLGPHA